MSTRATVQRKAAAARSVHEQEVAAAVAAYIEHGTLLERMVADAVYWHWRYNESNPDVGWGPLMKHMVDDHLAAHKLTGIVDKDEVLRLVKQATGEWYGDT